MNEETKKTNITATYQLHIQTFCLVLLASISIAAAMKLFSAVIIPFILAIFLTFCFSPVIEVQMRLLRIPRSIALVTTIVLVFIVLLLVGLMVSAAVAEIVDNRAAYEQQIKNLFNKTVNSIDLERFGLQAESLSGSLLEMLSNAAKKVFSGTVNGIVSILSNGILVLIFMIFMLSGKGIRNHASESVLSVIESQIKRYTFTMLLTSSATGFLVGLTLRILGVDFAWMFGFLAFLLNFIPSIGSIIATIFPIPVILLSPELSAAAKVLAIAIPSAIQFTIGNLLQPKLMGQSLDLHPVTILLSLMFFGAIWGIIGMLLATPITAALKILLEKFEYTRSVACLMAGRIETGRLLYDSD
jgi:AI-2 transport protein TqsA